MCALQRPVSSEYGGDELRLIPSFVFLGAKFSADQGRMMLGIS